MPTFGTAMPRRPRPDLQPEILLPDTREALRRANEAAGTGYNVPRVRRVGEKPINDGFLVIMNAKQRWLREIKRSGGKLDEGLVAFMMENCAIARAGPVRDENGDHVVRDGYLVFRLTQVGCRIYMNQEGIAEQYGCSRQHVNEQIGRMKHHGLIVNQGHGWYEFDANLCWRGNLDIQAAYRQQQPVRNGRIVRRYNYPRYGGHGRRQRGTV